MTFISFTNSNPPFKMHGVKPDYEVSGKNFNGLAWPFKKGLSGTSRSRQFWPTGMASIGAGSTRLPWPVSNVQNVANHECDVLSSLMHPKRFLSRLCPNPDFFNRWSTPSRNPQIGFKDDMFFDKCIAHSALELSFPNGSFAAHTGLQWCLQFSLTP